MLTVESYGLCSTLFERRAHLTQYGIPSLSRLIPRSAGLHLSWHVKVMRINLTNMGLPVNGLIVFVTLSQGRISHMNAHLLSLKIKLPQLVFGEEFP